MLALIGIGLDTKDISAKALEFIKSSDIVILDGYTSIIGKESIDFISNETGKIPDMKPRSAFEDNLKETVSQARAKTLIILVIGDPLIATTHHIILDEAHNQGIETRVFHAQSIFSAAIGESGLDIYKFGPSTTLPFWSEHYKPTSFIDVISKNIGNKEHTLLLLDIDKEGPTPMNLNRAAEIIDAAQRQANNEIIKNETKILILADIGRDTQQIFYSKFSEIKKLAGGLIGSTISMIVPAELNFAEEETLRRFSA